MSLREEVLSEAKAAVCQRASVYGKPEDCFGKIAEYWRVSFPERKWTAADVALALCDLKRARLFFNPGHHDSQADLAGYAACVRECTDGDR